MYVICSVFTCIIDHKTLALRSKLCIILLNTIVRSYHFITQILNLYPHVRVIINMTTISFLANAMSKS